VAVSSTKTQSDCQSGDVSGKSMPNNTYNIQDTEKGQRWFETVISGQH